MATEQGAVLLIPPDRIEAAQADLDKRTSSPAFDQAAAVRGLTLPSDTRGRIQVLATDVAASWDSRGGTTQNGVPTIYRERFEVEENTAEGSDADTARLKAAVERNELVVLRDVIGQLATNNTVSPILEAPNRIDFITGARPQGQTARAIVATEANSPWQIYTGASTRILPKDQIAEMHKLYPKEMQAPEFARKVEDGAFTEADSQLVALQHFNPDAVRIDYETREDDFRAYRTDEGHYRFWSAAPRTPDGYLAQLPKDLASGRAGTAGSLIHATESLQRFVQSGVEDVSIDPNFSGVSASVPVQDIYSYFHIEASNLPDLMGFERAEAYTFTPQEGEELLRRHFLPGQLAATAVRGVGVYRQETLSAIDSLGRKQLSIDRSKRGRS